MARAKRGRAGALVQALTGSMVLLLAAGCSLKQAAPVKQTFLLEARRPAGPRASPVAPALRVRGLEVAAPFDGRAFVYRRGEQEYEADFYHEFLVPPRATLSEQTRQWLAAAGLFHAVLDSGSKRDPSLVLEGTVDALYGDFREKGAPKAVLEAHVAVVPAAESSRAGGLFFQRSYRREVALPEASAMALASGWSQALAQVLGALEEDLSRVRWTAP